MVRLNAGHLIINAASIAAYPLYNALRAPEFTFRAVDGPTVLAHDGEFGTEVTKASFSVWYRALPVFRPLP